MTEETNNQQEPVRGENGKFVKGKSGNKNGRPPGKKAEIPQNIKDFMSFFAHKNMRTVQRNFDKMSPTAQANFWLMMSKFLVPTKSENTASGDIRIVISDEDIKEFNEGMEE